MPVRWRMYAWSLCPAVSSSDREDLLPVHANTDEIVAHLFDVASLVFNFVAERFGPLVIAPARAGPARDADHFADQVFAVLILQIEQIFTDQCRPGPVRNAAAAQVVNEGIEITIVKAGDRLVRNRLERRLG